MRFAHFVITRFNLPISFKEDTNQVYSSIDDSYLEKRFILFEKFCLPSIKQQTCQNFKWLVLFDINTSPKYKQRIETLHNSYNQFIPCYFDIEKYRINIKEIYHDYYKEYISLLGTSEYYNIKNNICESIQRIILPQFMNDCIQNHTPKNIDYIVTTRIDNDDAFHKYFIEYIQQQVLEEKKFILLDYINGYRYILNKRFVSKFCFINGHFTTLIEPYKKYLHTVLYYNHIHADKVVPTKHIDCEPLYIELIHDSNVINSEKDILLSDFIYAIKHFRHKDYGYKQIHLSLYQIIKTSLRFTYIYINNYINYHLKQH